MVPGSRIEKGPRLYVGKGGQGRKNKDGSENKGVVDRNMPQENNGGDGGNKIAIFDDGM